MVGSPRTRSLASLGMTSWGLASRRHLRVRASDQVLELVQELVDVLELAVDGGEADVGDLVELAEALHDDRPDAGGRDLALLGVVEHGLDLVDDPVELDRRDGPLLAGLRQAGAQLVAVEP